MTNPTNQKCMAATGMDINTARQFLTADAATARAMWDYRAKGLKIDQAKAMASGLVPSRQSDARHERTKMQAQWAARDKKHAGPSLSVSKHVAGVRDGRAWLERNQVAAVDSIATINAALGEYPATGRAVIALPGSRHLEIIRETATTWAKNRKWPTSTATSYRANLRDARGRVISTTTFDSRAGDWMGKLAQHFGLPTGKKTAVTLSAAVTVHSTRSILGVTLHALELFGAPMGWCAVRGATTYHAPSCRQAVAGLTQKISKSAGVVHASDVLTTFDALAMGFCKPGIAQFCADIGLPDATKASVRELRRRITPEIADVYGRELKQIGVLA